MPRYRLYIDESGDHTYDQLHQSAKRYLSLTGTVIESSYYRQTFHPNFESLKQTHFPHNPDDPVILVRSQIIRRRGPFGVLKDPLKRAAWDSSLLTFLAQETYQVITVTIDKLDHLNRYQGAAYHPYHYCMALMLERYRGMLSYWGGRGDVLAESRGRVEDTELKQAYSDVWQRGTFYISGVEFQKVLTSRELKLKKKEHNIAGLQLADLLAAPSKQDILMSNGCPLPVGVPSRFTNQVIQAIRYKYNPYGRNFLG